LADQSPIKGPSWLTPEVKHVIAFVATEVTLVILNITSTDGSTYSLVRKGPELEKVSEAEKARSQVARNE